MRSLFFMSSHCRFIRQVALLLRKTLPHKAPHCSPCGYDNENSYTSQMPMRESANVNSFLCGKRRVATYGSHNQILLVKLAFASDELLINALLREKSPLRRTFFCCSRYHSIQLSRNTLRVFAPRGRTLATTAGTITRTAIFLR